MVMRGFSGDFETGGRPGIRVYDIVYVTVWLVFFIAARTFNLPAAIGELFT
jgi:cobalt/nickel transport system permease protein